jgi:hypothetical protein
MPFESPMRRGRLMRLLLRLPGWAYMVVAVGGLAAALLVALQRVS